MAKFDVNDVVRVTRDCPNNTLLWRGWQGTVRAVDTTGRYEYFKVSADNGRSERTVSGGNLELVRKGVPPEPVKPVRELTVEELARRVIKVAREKAIEHEWCSVVDEALVEMGLGEFLEPTRRKATVTLTVEVDGEFSWTDDDYKYAVEEAITEENFVLDKVEYVSS